MQLNEDEKELIDIFRKLPYREQIKLIGKADLALEKYLLEKNNNKFKIIK